MTPKIEVVRDSVGGGSIWVVQINDKYITHDTHYRGMTALAARLRAALHPKEGTP